jgi:hypothetical protein
MLDYWAAVLKRVTCKGREVVAGHWEKWRNSTHYSVRCQDSGTPSLASNFVLTFVSCEAIGKFNCCTPLFQSQWKGTHWESLPPSWSCFEHQVSRPSISVFKLLQDDFWNRILVGDLAIKLLRRFQSSWEWQNGAGSSTRQRLMIYGIILRSVVEEQIESPAFLEAADVWLVSCSRAKVYVVNIVKKDTFLLNE